MMNVIYNEDCLITLGRMGKGDFNVVLTSPPYNMTKRKGGISDTGRYDVYVDWKTDTEYIDWLTNIFNLFNEKMSENGVVLFNLSYSIENPLLPFKVIVELCEKTNFSLVDTIIWEKNSGLPFPANPRRLSRKCEYVFVLVRKNEIDTFITNRKVKSVSEKTGQKYYEVAYNYVKAANNDSKCSLNQATYSSDLCKQLLTIYAPLGTVVYDPFMGTGTTAVACVDLGLQYIGSEISKAQCEYAEKRIKEEKDIQNG